MVTGCVIHVLIYSLFQLLNLLEVIIDNAESNLPDKSGTSTNDQMPAQTTTTDAGMKTDSHSVSSMNSVPSSDVAESSKRTPSNECDTQTVLLNLPQQELQLLCSLLAREG